VRKSELYRKHFIAEEDIVLVTEYRVGSCKPAWAVKFGVVESKLADELGIFRTAALDAFPHIQDDETILPITQISQSVNDLNIVQVAAPNLRLPSNVDLSRCGR